jgi:sialate O-acetylesterase
MECKARSSHSRRAVFPDDSGKNTVTLHNILVGEVWVCSGQSNMAMTVGATMPPYFTGVTDFQDEIHNATFPNLRLFTVEQTVASKPQRDVKGFWTSPRPDSVTQFSAVGYFFGRDLLQSLNVPVGMICASQGSTTAEVWTSHEALQSDPDFKSILDGEAPLLAAYPKVFTDFEQQFAQWKQTSEIAECDGRPIPPPPAILGILVRTSTVPLVFSTA